MIYYKKHFLTISFLILLINNCYCNSIFREDKINRNLGFEKRNNDLTPWCGYPYQNIILFDSINHIEGKYSIAIRPFPVFSGNKVRIAQRFYIKEAKKIHFSVFHKSNSSWNTTLSLEGYNKLGISIFRKENKIDVENEWKSSNISIQTPPLVEYITISINSTFLNQSSPFTSRLWIDKAIVIIDDKIVTNYEYPTIKEDVFNNEELANKKFINPQNIGELDLYKNKKILGIGESIHGSASIEKFYLNYFKYLVINKKTKVLLFELPYEMVLTWNQFINEQTEIPLDQLIEKELLVDREALKDFLFWLRDYQKTNNSKILLIGIDIKY